MVKTVPPSKSDQSRPALAVVAPVPSQRLWPIPWFDLRRRALADPAFVPLGPVTPAVFSPLGVLGQ